MSGMTVAKTIAAQMGGTGRLKAMVGGCNFTGDNKSLTFKFKMNRKMNCLRVTLDPSDTYTMEFLQVKKYEFKVVEAIPGVYCDMLKDIFEKKTGLYLSF